MADSDVLPAVLAVGLLLILGTLTGSALATQALQPEKIAPEEGVLHLRGDPGEGGSYRNFTTHSPNGTGPLLVTPCSIATQRSAQWCWQMHRSPEPWTLSAGAQAEATLHLGHLDRVPLGLHDPEDPAKSGRLRIDVILTRGTSDEVAHGTTWIEPPALTGNKQTIVRVPLDVPEDAHWNTEPGDAPAVELQVHLSGLVRRDEPPSILTGSQGHDSRLVLPGFPMEAFREWEQEEHEEKGCREKILAQRSCEDGTETDATKRPQTTLTEEAPVHGLITLLGAALLAGVKAARRRRS